MGNGGCEKTSGGEKRLKAEMPTTVTAVIHGTVARRNSTASYRSDKNNGIGAQS